MNGGLDPEYTSPEDKVKEEIRWIDRKLNGQYTAEYKAHLRQEKLILTLQLIDIKGNLSFVDKSIIRSLIFQIQWWKYFILGLCVGAAIVFAVCAYTMKGM